MAANVVFSIGQIYTDRVARLRRTVTTSSEERHTRDQQIRQAWNDLVRHYEGFMRTYAASGTLDQKIQGAVALARGYWNVQNIRQATAFYQQAVDAWGPSTGEGAAMTSGRDSGRDSALGQNAAASTTASGRSGITSMTSVKRIRPVSVLPPRKPAVMPISPPMATEMNAAKKPTVRDTREP